jgi:hypothetical protein
MALDKVSLNKAVLDHMVVCFFMNNENTVESGVKIISSDFSNLNQSEVTKYMSNIDKKINVFRILD